MVKFPAGASILDLGSGSGGFAEYAAKNKHWHITGYTLSNAQLEYCKQLIEKNHLGKLVSFEYRDMIEYLPTTQFNGIALIESIEHVGQKKIPQFFNQLYRSLSHMPFSSCLPADINPTALIDGH